jgi:hypothetical protein
MNARLRAMRFALWAQHTPERLLTVRQISGLLNISKCSACKWRRDLLSALSPIEIEGIPYFLTPATRDAAAPITPASPAKPTRRS